MIIGFQYTHLDLAIIQQNDFACTYIFRKTLVCDVNLIVIANHFIGCDSNLITTDQIDAAVFNQTNPDFRTLKIS